jgi:hypothetical protein
MGEGYQLPEHQRTHHSAREAIELARAAPAPIATVDSLKSARRRCAHGIALNATCFECGRRRSAPYSQ